MNVRFVRLMSMMTLPLVAACATESEPARSSETPEPTAAATPGANRVFELRIYTANEGKLPALEQRFRDHTTRIFERIGMTNIGYWIPQDSLSQNTLVYVLAYPSREEATRMWNTFRADSEWVAVKAASEVDGLLVQSVQSIFMDPTDYSPMR